jgi:hypothetical protein
MPKFLELLDSWPLSYDPTGRFKGQTTRFTGTRNQHRSKYGIQTHSKARVVWSGGTARSTGTTESPYIAY